MYREKKSQKMCTVSPQATCAIESVEKRELLDVESITAVSRVVATLLHRK